MAIISFMIQAPGKVAKSFGYILEHRIKVITSLNLRPIVPSHIAFSVLGCVLCNVLQTFLNVVAY
jgi:hypothetical protein